MSNSIFTDTILDSNNYDYTSAEYWFIPIQYRQSNIIDFSIFYLHNTKSHIACCSSANNIGTLVYDTQSNEFVKIILTDKYNSDSQRNVILTNFYNYTKYRSEFIACTPFDLSDMDKIKAVYEHKLTGAYKIKMATCGENPDSPICNDSICKCIKWLETTDFYTAPASTKYHDCVNNGLLLHICKTYNIMLQLLSLPMYTTLFGSALFVTLVHDWCKIFRYGEYPMWRKDPNGEWCQEIGYKRKAPYVGLGHGVDSAYLAATFFQMSTQEFAAIRWHMGRWHCSSDELDDLQKCNECYPLVLLLQFADQLSITEYAK